MGQIITSLIRFYIEVYRSNKEYENKDLDRRKSITFKKIIIILALILAFYFLGFYYVERGENIKLRNEIKELQKYKLENESLKIKNDLLSETLSAFIGEKFIEQINKEKAKKESTKQ